MLQEREDMQQTFLGQTSISIRVPKVGLKTNLVSFFGSTIILSGSNTAATLLRPNKDILSPALRIYARQENAINLSKLHFSTLNIKELVFADPLNF